MIRRLSDMPSLLYLLAGFGIWSMAFLSLYGTLSLGCAMGWDGVAVIEGFSLQRVLLVAAFLFYLVAAIALTLITRRKLDAGDNGPVTGRFIGSAAHYLSIAAAISTLFTFGGTVVLSPCL